MSNFIGWFLLHWVELIPLPLLFWIIKEISALKIDGAKRETQIASINRAVNNVGAEEKTLRQHAVETSDRVARIEGILSVNDQ